MAKRFITFGSIDQFRTIIKNVQHMARYVECKMDTDTGISTPIYDGSLPMPKVTATGSEKIHGSNASENYSIPDGQWSQSRKNIITPENDNMGCAFAANQNKDAWLQIITALADEWNIDLNKYIISIFYEWSGGNIQKKSALTGLDKRAMIFQYFKVSPIEPTIKTTLGALSETGMNKSFSYDGRDYKLIGTEADKFIVEDDGNLWCNVDVEIDAEDSRWLETSILPNNQPIIWLDIPSRNIFNIMNYPTIKMEIDFERPDIAQNKFIELIEQHEKNSPVGQKFGIENNILEGYVWTFEYKGSVHRFKVKGDEHAASKVKTLKPVDSVKEQAKIDFATYACPAWRLEQMYKEIQDENGSISIKDMGTFLKKVHGDIIKEESDIMAEKGLEPKEVNGKISQVAKNWFQEQLNSEVGL